MGQRMHKDVHVVSEFLFVSTGLERRIGTFGVRFLGEP